VSSGCRSTGLLLLALALMGAAPVSPDAASEARLVEAALNGTSGLIASFTQTLESAALPRPQVEEGTVFLLRPGRMRWEYDRPKGKVAVADGHRTYLYLPDDRQVIVAPLDSGGEAAGSGMSLLLQANLDLVGAFSISWGPEPRDGGQRPLLLTPRQTRPAYQYLLLEPDGDHLIRALTVVDPLGSRVTYRFGAPRRVGTLPESLFRFTPPKGVEVQEVP
jgi:outer membrane lipoprotein carrier protein